MRRWTAIAGVVAAIAVALVGLALRRPPQVQVITASTTTGTITRRIIATGTLQAVITVQVGSQVSGIVEALPVDFNSIVHKGEIVARLDPSLFEAALQQAKATLAQARADVARYRTAAEDARQKLDRAEALAVKQLLAQSDLDAARIVMAQATADVQAAESHVREAQAAVDQAQTNLDYTIIRSPIDGFVVARNVDVGQTVAATLQSPVLFNIAADLRHMQLLASIDEADIGGIRVGETATFEVESYSRDTFHGIVSQVRLQPVAEQTTTATSTLQSTTTAAATQPTTASSTPTPTAPGASTTTVATVISYTVVIEVDNPDEKLRPGMTATLILDGSRRDNVIRIPNNALSFRPPPDVLAAIGQPEPRLDDPDTDSDVGRRAHVWQFDGHRFTPTAVRAGLADDAWTELLSGDVRPDEPLATSATVSRRPPR